MTSYMWRYSQSFSCLKAALTAPSTTKTNLWERRADHNEKKKTVDCGA